VQPTAGLYTYRALAHQQQRRTRQALSDATNAIRLEPRSAHAHYRAARALLAEERYVEAGGALCDGLRHSPRHERAAGTLDAALSHIRRGRAYWPGAPRKEADTCCGTPPRPACAPGACDAPAVADATARSLHVAWAPVSDDGGDEVYQYELQLAPVDPLRPEAPLEFRTACTCAPSAEGARLATTLGELDADRDYVLRVAAVNSRGRGAWSAEARASTAPPARAVRSLDTRIPRAWLDVQHNMGDVLVRLRKQHGCDVEEEWDSLLAAWRAHLPVLKLAFRMYVLLAAAELQPSAMSLTQFRRFVDDCHVLRQGASKTEVDLIFTRVNRARPRGPREPVAAASVRNDKMGQDEFVHALVRLAVLRAEQAGAFTGLGECFARLVDDCIVPHAAFSLEDKMSELLRSRGVRAALAKHRDALSAQFCRWAGTDRTVGSRADAMSLAELMVVLREAKLLDEKCTAKEVTGFFVMVNADDEIYCADARTTTAREESKGAAELDFEEFCEMACRICNEQLPEPRETAFELALDTWLGLVFLPKLRNAKLV
jgi:hypothetical protein